MSTAQTTTATGMDWDAIATLISGSLGAIATVVGVSVAAYLAYRFAVRQIRISHHHTIRQHRQMHKLSLQQQELSHKLALQQEELNHKLALQQETLAQEAAHRHSIEQERIAHNISVQSSRLQREIAALEAIWELLAYASDKKSQYAILHWDNRRDDAGNKTMAYFYHWENLEQFCLNALSDVFYKQHAGLFISSEVRDKLYGYRHLVGALYITHLKNPPEATEDGLYPIHQAKQAEKLKESYQECNAALKKALQERYEALQIAPDASE